MRWPALACLLAACACDPGGRAEAAAGPREGVRADCRDGLPMCAAALSGVLREARLAASAELCAIARRLPLGARDQELAWVLGHADGVGKAGVIRALDVPEVVRLRPLLRACARSGGDERDAALAALARAGEVDVLPLVARALRSETGEASLVALAEAARLLGPFKPVRELGEALGRARTARALVALTRALGHDLGPGALRVLAGRGAEGDAALCLAMAILRTPRVEQGFERLGLTRERCRQLLDGSALPSSAADLERLARLGVTRFDLEQLLGGSPVLAPVERHGEPDSPPPGVPVPAAAVPLLRARFSELVREDEARCSRAVGALACRVRANGADARASAHALGTIGTAEAVAALAEALFEVDAPACEAVSAALAAALRIGPERSPEDPKELRRLWIPILRATVPAARGATSALTSP